MSSSHQWVVVNKCFQILFSVLSYVREKPRTICTEYWIKRTGPQCSARFPRGRKGAFSKCFLLERASLDAPRASGCDTPCLVRFSLTHGAINATVSADAGLFLHIKHPAGLWRSQRSTASALP